MAATAAPATTDFESFVGIKRENREETASSHHGTLIALDIQQMYNDEEMEDNKVGVIDVSKPLWGSHLIIKFLLYCLLYNNNKTHLVFKKVI